jgi:hypothetical protein
VFTFFSKHSHTLIGITLGKLRCKQRLISKHVVTLKSYSFYRVEEHLRIVLKTALSLKSTIKLLLFLAGYNNSEIFTFIILK